MRLERDDVTALARGYALLGSGGGGSTTMLELMLAADDGWPIEVTEIDALPDDTPCLGVAFVGSTMLLGERMPGSTRSVRCSRPSSAGSGIRCPPSARSKAAG